MVKIIKTPYHIKGIGGRNKPKNKTPLPVHLMKDNKYPKIKMWLIKEDKNEENN